MVIRTVLTTFALVTVFLGQPGTPEQGVQEVLQRILLRVRGVEDKAIDQWLASDALPSDAKLLKEIRDRLRPTSDAPMSELSAPMVFVRAVTVDAPGRASACAYIERIGSVVVQRLAAYEIVAAKLKESKEEKDDWRIVTIKTGGRCNVLIL